MNEVEKMYKNAGVEKRAYYNSCPKGQHLSNNITCYKCEYFSIETPYLKCSYRVYPLFTAEKQIELIKWLASYYTQMGDGLIISMDKEHQIYGISGSIIKADCADRLEHAIAENICGLWQDLTEKERKQIRGILE